VGLAGRDGDPADRAAAVAGWLRDIGVIVPDGQPGGGYLAGPGADLVAPGVEGVAGARVEVQPERRPYLPGAAYQPVNCPKCGTELPAAGLEELTLIWVNGDEPVAACTACGHAALLGDWPGNAGAVGAPAVTFHAWPTLTAEFTAELGSRLGGRWSAVVSG
jgi:hypothetical protein